MIEKTIKNDLSVIGSQNASFFTGVEDTFNQYLDPFVNGYAFIYWVSLPSWFEEDKDLKYFKRMTQTNFRSFNGISPIELQTGTVQTGFAGHEINVVTGVSRQNTEFQIGHKEYSGTPMTKMYRKWISLVRDPRTGIAVYPKLYNVEYGARNHTGQLLYIVTRPDVTATQNYVVETARFYTNVFPTNVPDDTLFNFELGQQETANIDISFRGFPEMGPDVDEWAQKILREKILATGSDSYLPFVDMYNTNTEASTTVTWGENALKDIFVNTESVTETTEG